MAARKKASGRTRRAPMTAGRRSGLAATLRRRYQTSVEAGLADLRPQPIKIRSLGPPPRSCREALDVLALVLAAAPPDAARGFWDVITALRGPDVTAVLNGGGDMMEVKLATTCPIRHAALGVMPEVFGAATRPERDGNQLVRRELRQAAWHFREHARAAFRALGLTW